MPSLPSWSKRDATPALMRWWRPWPLGVSLCAAWPMWDHLGVITLLSWGGASALAWAWDTRRPRREHEQRPTAEDPAIAADASRGLPALLRDVLPTWRDHLETVRMQTESAVVQLATSFASINHQFETAGFIGSGRRSNEETKTFDLLTLCERQLHPVVASMRSMLDNKATVVDSINQLARAVKEMRGMAEDVSKIAAHTNILAINAAIEAARAGHAGNGFAVIAKEIRELSTHSGETGKQISLRIRQIETIMIDTVRKADEASVNDGEAIELSGNVVEDVLAHVRAMGAEAEAMREKGNLIRNETDNLLVHLQFQDRTSQIIGALGWDIERLATSAQDPASPLPASAEWLGELSTRYTMDDQRHTSAARAGSEPAPAAEIEFF